MAGWQCSPDTPIEQSQPGMSYVHKYSSGDPGHVFAHSICVVVLVPGSVSRDQIRSMWFPSAYRCYLKFCYRIISNCYLCWAASQQEQSGRPSISVHTAIALCSVGLGRWWLSESREDCRNAKINTAETQPNAVHQPP